MTISIDGIWRFSLQQRIDAAFLPPRVLKRPSEAKRARVFLVSHLFGPVLGLSAPSALWALDPMPGADVAVLALSILAFWAFPPLLRLDVPYWVLLCLSLLNLHFAILWSCFHHGGVASPTAIWILIVPVLSVFYIGGDRALLPCAALASGVSLTAFGVAWTMLDPPRSDLPAEAALALGVVSTAAVAAYAAAMATYYARIFDAGHVLEEEVARHRASMAELRAAVAAIERAGAAKSRFLARTSHELRSPLNAVIGYGELLQEEASEAGDRRVSSDVERILDAGRYLLRLIDRILDLARIDAHRMTFDRRRHDIAALVEAAVDEARPAAEGSGNRVEVSLAPDLGNGLMDATRFREVLDAILLNAVQHTRDGVVAVHAHRDEHEGGVVVSVSDTGEGMTPEILESVFETFATPQEAAAGRYGGTGLSLAVASRMCAAMGGRIEASSAPGSGSRFTVVLPIMGDRRAPAGTDGDIDL